MPTKSSPPLLAAVARAANAASAASQPVFVAVAIGRLTLFALYLASNGASWPLLGPAVILTVAWGAATVVFWDERVWRYRNASAPALLQWAANLCACAHLATQSGYAVSAIAGLVASDLAAFVLGETLHARRGAYRSSGLALGLTLLALALSLVWRDASDPTGSTIASFVLAYTAGALLR